MPVGDRTGVPGGLPGGERTGSTRSRCAARRCAPGFIVPKHRQRPARIPQCNRLAQETAAKRARATLIAMSGPLPAGTPSDDAVAGLAPLQGFTIGVTADRRAGEQAELLRRQGARVVHGPTITTGYLTNNDRLLDATRSLVARPPDVLVTTTAIGLRAWWEAAQSWGLDGALRLALADAVVVARGPKAAGVARGLGLVVWRQSPDERSSGLLGVLTELAGGVRGPRVAVQLHGGDDELLLAGLAAFSADVVEVPVYRWALPEDLGPALALIDAAVAGSLDAVTFTAAPALAQLFTIAARHGNTDALRAAFNGEVVAACVGPACADKARYFGIADPAAPDVGRLGLMVRALAARLASHRHRLRAANPQVVVQGRAVSIDGTIVELTEREHEILRVLLRHGGAVLTRTVLLRAVWSADHDPHVVEVAVGRLRRKLGPAGSSIVTVPRRGYRLLVQT